METDKNKQYQLKAQQFYKLVEQYKQTKGARQEIIEMFDRCLHTIEKLHTEHSVFHSTKVPQHDYDLVSHYCSMTQYYIHQSKKG